MAREKKATPPHPPATEGTPKEPEATAQDALLGGPIAGVSREERQKLLAAIWGATARAIIASLAGPSDDNANAASINVARQFLSDNAASHSTLDQLTGQPDAAQRRAVESLMVGLTDDGVGSALAPLHGWAGVLPPDPPEPLPNDTRPAS